jgi:cobalt/nickel transport system permease protein
MHASSNPDGLEWSIEKTANTTEIDANGTVYDNASYIQRLLSVFPDYDFQSGSGNGTSLAGLIGAGMTCLLALGCGGAIKFIKKKNQG